MPMNDDFEFLNSDVWIKYTQERYVPLDDTKYRLETLGQLGHKESEWRDLRNKIQSYRKLNSIPLFINTIGKNFWYFPSDCIQKKISNIEHLGNKIFERIESQGSLKNDFLGDAAMEEAITSAIYEGANSTRAKAEELLVSERAPDNKDEWMLLNNYLAMKWIKANFQKLVSNKLILEIHNIVTKNTLEGDDVNFQGKFRNDKVYVGSHQGIEHSLIEKTLDEAINSSVENKRYLHGLIKGILLHYFTAYIHPFFDGNGRTARTLFYFKCMKNDLKFVELLSISAHLKRGKGNRYERAFELVVENDLDVTYFIDYCLDSLIDAIKVVEEKITYLLNINVLATNYDLNKNQILLLQRLALNKFKGVTSLQHADTIHRTREIARKELKDLYNKKFLREVKSGNQILYFVESKYLKETVQHLAVTENTNKG